MKIEPDRLARRVGGLDPGRLIARGMILDGGFH
jgi:hypothetical protein